MCRGPVFVVPQKNPSSRRRLPRSPRRRLTCPYDDMSPVFRNSKHGLHIVIFGKRYGALKPAAQTALNNAVVARRSFKRDGLHHSPAGRRPVARLHVYMFAPETFRTMIGVSVAFYGSTAVFTRKIFNCSFETHRRSATCPVRNAAHFLMGCSQVKSSMVRLNILTHHRGRRPLEGGAGGRGTGKGKKQRDETRRRGGLSGTRFLIPP